MANSYLLPLLPGSASFQFAEPTLFYDIISRAINLFKMMNNKKTKKGVILIIILLAIIVSTVFVVRMFSQEDDWICKDGVWVKHGEPSASQPDSPCQ